MKNGDIEIDKDGKKWIWTNSMFYEYDNRSREEKMSDLPKYIANNPKEFFETVKNMAKILGEIDKN
jgi:hypothetical protein